MMSNSLDDSSYWARVASEELVKALDGAGIPVLDCYGDEEGVSVAFPDLKAAEALMTLSATADRQPGSLYDRATSSCVALAHLAEQYQGGVPDHLVSEALSVAWQWNVHPHMTGRAMGWHVSLEFSAADANQVTATLNSLRHGGAL